MALDHKSVSYMHVPITIGSVILPMLELCEGRDLVGEAFSLLRSRSGAPGHY